MAAASTISSRRVGSRATPNNYAHPRLRRFEERGRLETLPTTRTVRAVLQKFRYN